MEQREKGGEGGMEGDKTEEERTPFNICNTFYFKLVIFSEFRAITSNFRAM